MTKEEVEAKVKEILAKDKKYKDAKVTLVFSDKKKQKQDTIPSPWSKHFFSPIELPLWLRG